MALPSAGAAGGGAPVALLLTPLPSPAPPPEALSCTLLSTPLQVRDGANLPRYGAATTVALPLAFAPPPPSTALLLAAVWVESRVVAGAFRVVGGAGAGGAVLPTLPPPDLIFLPENTTAAWSDASLGDGDAAGALAPLLALADATGLGAGGLGAAPPSFSATLSGATHLLLFLSNASAPFVAGATNVALNGAPCALNWVAPDGRLASVTTPPLSELCASSTGGDCGEATLLLFTGGDPLDALVAALEEGTAPPLPAAYPPLHPPLSAITPAPAWGALVGLNTSSLLPIAAALSQDGMGFRLAAACTDPSFAAPEFCALAGGAPPPPPPNGTSCAWGAGDACVPCPADKALCPGGAVLLPRPGWWAPLRTSPPGDLLPCPEPGAAARCPGWAGAAASSGGCAPAFRGQACSGCAPGFFPSAGSCAPCPRLSAALAQAVPILSFAGALAGMGTLLLGAAQAALARGGRAPPACGSPDGAPRAVAGLLAWAWVSAQSAAALFSQTVEAGLVPPPLLPAFSVLAALQFVGVTLSPACYTSIPFSSLWASVGLATGALLILRAAAEALPRLREGAPCARLLGPLLRASALLLSVGYGAFVNAAVTVLTCRLPSPMLVSEYARAASDGRALGVALGAAAPPLAALRAAAEDPFLAHRAGLTAVLRATIPVATLASDPFTVCREGAHAVAWPAAAAFLLLLVVGVPGLGLWALWGEGRLKGLRRALSSSTRGGGLGGASAPTAAALLSAVLVDNSLRPPWAWLTFYQFVLTALCSGVVALTQRAASPAQFIALQTLLIVATLGSAGLVARARPFLPRERWRAPVQVALYLLASASAAVNLVMRFAGEAAARGSLGWGLASTLLALAAGTLLLLFGGWWAALVARARGMGATGGATPSAVAPVAEKAMAAGPTEKPAILLGGTISVDAVNPLFQLVADAPPPASPNEALWVVDNPLGLVDDAAPLLPSPPSPPAPVPPPPVWERVLSRNGSIFWLDRESGDTSMLDPTLGPVQRGETEGCAPIWFDVRTGLLSMTCPPPEGILVPTPGLFAPAAPPAPPLPGELKLSLPADAGGFIGLAFAHEDGTFVAVHAAEGGAARAGGLRAGDVLLRFAAAAGVVETADFGDSVGTLARALGRAPRPLQLTVVRAPQLPQLPQARAGEVVGALPPAAAAGVAPAEVAAQAASTVPFHGPEKPRHSAARPLGASATTPADEGAAPPSDSSGSGGGGGGGVSAAPASPPPSPSPTVTTASAELVLTLPVGLLGPAGLTIAYRLGSFVVVSVAQGSRAQAAGVLPGDALVRVATARLTLEAHELGDCEHTLAHAIAKAPRPLRLTLDRRRIALANA